MSSRSPDQRVENLQRKVRSSKAKPRQEEVGRLEVPGITRFVTDKQFLARAMLYPRQATLLKILSLRVDELTSYDYAVIKQWESGFRLETTEDGRRYVGYEGTPTGVVERMQHGLAINRWFMREAVLVLGRRAGKGHVTALMLAYLVWRLLALGHPQKTLGVDPTKTLLILILAADERQAITNQFDDVVRVITEAPCFAKYLGRITARSIQLRTPADLARDPDHEGSIVIEARAATSNSGRGPAVVAYVHDEMAHGKSPELLNSMDAIYEATTPALATFPEASLTLLNSSSWAKIGKFYETHEYALRVDDNDQPLDPTLITLQLPSWELYEDWEIAETLPMWPAGPTFAPLPKAQITPDSPEVLKALRTDPHRHAVEYLSRWRTSPWAFLEEDVVAAIFGTYGDSRLTMQSQRSARHEYVMHADPGVTDSNYGVAIGHLELDANGTEHVVFDFLHHWRAQDFPEGRIQYGPVREKLWELITEFQPSVVTFDQFNSEETIQILAARLSAARLGSRIEIKPRQATADRNAEDADTFKRLAEAGCVHAPLHKAARDELSYLLRVGEQRVDHPKTGPVQTSDIAVSMFAVTYQLLQPGRHAVQRLREVPLMPSWQHGYPGGAGPYAGGSPRGELRSGRRSQAHNPARGIRRRGR